MGAVEMMGGLEVPPSIRAVSASWSPAPGTVLLWQGRVPDVCFGLQSGLIELSLLSEEGSETVVDVLGAGEWVGFSHVLADYKCAFTAKSLKDSQLFVVRKAALSAVVATAPGVQRWLRLLALRNAERQARRFATFVRGTTEERLRFLLEENAEYLWRSGLTQTELARLVGVSRQRMNEALQRLRRESCPADSGATALPVCWKGLSGVKRLN